MKLPFFSTPQKYKFIVYLANDQTFLTNNLTYGKEGVFLDKTQSSYMFIPYTAILRIDYNENNTKQK